MSVAYRLVQLLSYTLQDHLPSRGTAHSELGLLHHQSSIEMSQTCPQANLMKVFLNGVFSFQMI